MLADPTPLQCAAGDTSYDLVSTLGQKTIRRRTDTVDTADGMSLGTLTVSHDENAKTGRIRSVLRIDTQFVDTVNGLDGKESVAAYLVLDRPLASAFVKTPVHIKSALAQILSFFATDPTAATPSSIPLAISTSNGTKLLAGEP